MLRDDIMDIKKEVNDLKEQSLAYEILQDSKKANKRMFILLIIILCMWFATIGLFVYYISTTGYEEETITNTNTQEISEIETIENSNIINGDMYGEDKTN